MGMKYRWLLFDADDTLFDYPKAEAKALRWTFEQFGLCYQSDYLPIYHKYNQQVWREFEMGQVTTLELRTKRFGLLFTEIGVSADPKLFSPLYLKNLARGSDLFEGVTETLQTLSKYHHIGLVTNGLADVQRPRLESSSIYALIEKVFISEEIGVAKPDPAYFDIVFQAIGNPDKSEVLIIGDSLTSDMRGGLQYGIDTCWYNPARKTTDLPVTYQIQNLHELIPMLGQLMAQ
jgi:2-haloacid dehalogenase